MILFAHFPGLIYVLHLYFHVWNKIRTQETSVSTLYISEKLN